MKTPFFVILYLVIMMFTYLWRAVIFGAPASATPEEIRNVTLGINVILFLNYIILIVIAYFRGKKIDKKYLVAFPLIGGFFDMVLVFIPFVPTIMNVLTLIVGLSDGKQEIRVVYVEKPTSETKSESKS